MNYPSSNNIVYKRKRLYDYALAMLALLMPLVVKGFPVLIVIAATIGIAYFFRAYQRLGKPKKDYYILPYNLLKDAFVNIFKFKGPLLLMVILFFVYFASTFISFNKSLAFQKIILKSCYLYFPIIFSLTKWDKSRLLLVLDFFIYGCCLQVLISLLDAFWASGFQFNSFEFTYVNLSFNLHPGYAAFLVNIGFIFNSIRIISLYKEKSSLSGNWWRLIALVGFLAYIMLLSSKAGILTIMVTIVTLIVYSLIIFRSLKFSIFLILFSLSIVSMFSYIFGGRALIRYNRMKNSIEKKQELTDKTKKISSSSIRLVLWKNSWEAIKKSNYLGYGLGSGKKALQNNLKINEEKFVFGLNHNAHNQFLEIMLSIGFVGFLFLISILLTSFIGFGQFTTISMLLIFIITVNFGVESMMEKQSGSIPIVWLLCLLASGKPIFKSVFKF